MINISDFEFDESDVDVDTVLEKIKAAFEEKRTRLERISDANSESE